MHSINPSLDLSTREGLAMLGAHIKKARKEAFKESRVDFAKRLGCVPMTLDRIERGDPGVAVMYLMAALQVMGVLHDVVEAASPKLLIATLVPATFPPGFATEQPANSEGA
jgi:hypothetical protein